MSYDAELTVGYRVGGSKVRVAALAGRVACRSAGRRRTAQGPAARPHARSRVASARLGARSAPP